MATKEDYAKWIVANADKKGTPEFDTVVRAYQEPGTVSAPVKTEVSPEFVKKSSMSSFRGENPIAAGAVDLLGGMSNLSRGMFRLAGEPIS